MFASVSDHLITFSAIPRHGRSQVGGFPEKLSYEPTRVVEAEPWENMIFASGLLGQMRLSWVSPMGRANCAS